MSSASKGLRRAGIGGLSALLAATAMTGLATTAQGAWAAAGGEIGIVDTDHAAVDTQGATLLLPGKAEAQDMGDVRLLVPNSFTAGDTIDIALYDRSVSATDRGTVNTDAAHKFSFTGTPKAAAAGPYMATAISPTNDGVAGNDTGNTEDVPTPWDVAAPAIKPATAPTFNVSLEKSSRGSAVGATDILRLQVNNTATPGSDPTGQWTITVSDIQALVGPAVAPGDVHLVPFSYNGNPPGSAGSTPSTLFTNVPDDDTTTAWDPTITDYTSNAFVAPVTISQAAPSNIQADGFNQNVGDITIGETNGYSLQPGTYTLTIDGATLANDQTDADLAMKVELTGGATGETATIAGFTQTGPETWEVDFTLAAGAGDVNATKASIKLSNILLNDATDGAITYGLSGGSIDNFFADAGSQGAIAGQLPADPAGVNQTDISGADALASLVSAVSGISVPTADRIGGADRYATAAKLALDNATGSRDMVLASGEDFPDALSSNYLASLEGAGILLTRKGSIPAATLNAIRTAGTRTVYIVGGTNAISSAVESQLRNTKQYEFGGTVTTGQGNLQVIRLAGADRYATNKAVNEYAAAVSTTSNPVGRTQPVAGQPTKLTAVVATGDSFADAMTSGPATTRNLPLILTRSSSLSASAAAQFSALDIEHAVIAGGTAAVSDSVKSAI